MLDADEELPAAQHAKLLADMKKSEAMALSPAAGQRRPGK